MSNEQISTMEVTLIDLPKLCVGVENLHCVKDVFCLKLDSVHNFAINNGVIVSNCGDETRYMLVAAMTLGQTAQDEADYDPYAKIEQFNKLNNTCNLAMAGSGYYDTGWR